MSSTEGLSRRRTEALEARRQEMVDEELTHPDGHYLDRYTDENRQRLSAHR